MVLHYYASFLRIDSYVQPCAYIIERRRMLVKKNNKYKNVCDVLFYALGFCFLNRSGCDIIFK